MNPEVGPVRTMRVGLREINWLRSPAASGALTSNAVVRAPRILVTLCGSGPSTTRVDVPKFKRRHMAICRKVWLPAGDGPWLPSRHAATARNGPTCEYRESPRPYRDTERPCQSRQRIVIISAHLLRPPSPTSRITTAKTAESPSSGPC